jgi:hypothetical protein
MTETTPLVCKVCHRPVEASDQYLVRFDAAGGTTVVHRSLCFPPARAAEHRQPVAQRAVA